MTSTTPHSGSARLRLVRGLSLTLVAFSALGLVAVATPPSAQAVVDSSVTVAWAGGNDTAVQKYQPTRPDATDTSGDYEDFKDLKVTVDRTQNLTDGGVRVSYDGMGGTNASTTPGQAFRYNYLGLMQCWGPDPLAPDFAETCQWGGKVNSDRPISGGTTSGSYLSNSQLTSEVISRGGVAFRSAQGGGYTAADPLSKRLEYFGETTSNEVSVAMVGADGHGETTFETQSASSSPHLGCGADDGAGAPRRCWLVVVPSGSHTQIADPTDPNFGGTSTKLGSLGTPFDPKYSRWNERIVIPLDFMPVGAACSSGAEEMRATGSALMSKAMGSWQRELCDKGLYSMVTNGDDVTRGQLLAGSTPFIYTSQPANAEAVSTAGADLVYAPVAATGLVIGYKFTTVTGTVTTADISPRLLAKLLTQSYPHQVAGVSTIASDVTYEHLAWANGIEYRKAFWEDPDVVRAFHLDDPANPSSRKDTNSLPLPQVLGPQTADAFAQVWAWMQADDEARAFLEGQPDSGNHGMTINPYYLPSGSPAAVVSPVYCVNGVPALWNGKACSDGEKVLDQAGQPVSKNVGLNVNLATEPINYFPKADETLAPYSHATVYGQVGWGESGNTRVDSVAQPSYAGSFEQVAQRIIRGDSSVLTLWQADAKGGTFKAQPVAWPASTFVIGILDAPTAEAFALRTARLQVPNEPGVFVGADAGAQGRTLDAQKATNVAGVTTTDFAALPDDAYPLTSIVYAAANLNNPAMGAEKRGKYADLIRYAAQSGNELGFGPGQLPPGYAPLNAALVTQALTAADALQAGPKAAPAAVPAPAPVSPPAANTNVTVPSKTSTTGAAPAAPGTTATSTSAATTVTAAEPTSSAVGSTALGGSLIAGLAGLVGAPFLLRRKPQ